MDREVFFPFQLPSKAGWYRVVLIRGSFTLTLFFRKVSQVSWVNRKTGESHVFLQKKLLEFIPDK